MSNTYQYQQRMWTISRNITAAAKARQRANASNEVVNINVGTTLLAPIAPLASIASSEPTSEPAVEVSQTITSNANEDAIPSPNNRLNDRSNSARLKSRIPDIYGTVRSVPDLLCQTYTVYDDHKPREISYLCVGKGEYTISDLREGDTPLDNISEVTYDIYGPYSSPQVNRGTIEEPFRIVVSSKFYQDKICHAPNYTPPPGQTVEYLTGPTVFRNVKEVITNFKIAAGEETPTIGFEIKYQQVDAAGVPFGTVHTETLSILGNSLERSISFFSNLPFIGDIQVTVKRTTNWAAPETNSEHKYLVVENMYGVLNITDRHFGNVTTIRTATLPYSQNSNRVLTCLASRKINGAVTSKFSDIAIALCLDPQIGNRDPEEIDIVGLKALQIEVEEYFGTAKAAEFNYTFDSNATTFEESLHTCCAAAFVTPYREGGVIKFAFNRAKTQARLIFNHRNKIPGSEKRVVSFGYLDEKDGVELEYIDNADGAKTTLNLPESLEYYNPETTSPVGITNKLQAYFHAHRQFAKQKYQNTTIEFEATYEASLLISKDLIFVSNNTRPKTYDGEIVKKDDMILTLSQPYTFIDTFATIFIQTPEGFVESVVIYPVEGNQYQVELGATTINNISLSENAYSRATYEIVSPGDSKGRYFLVTGVAKTKNMTVGVIAVNYDDRYYSHDNDFIAGVVNSNGDLV